MDDWREFTVPGAAVPWSRAGAHGKRHFTPAPQANFMGVLKLYAQRCMDGAGPLDVPVQCEITAFYVMPASWPKRRREAPGALWKSSKPDYDNLGKIVGDALNGVAWVDDALICDGRILKRYGDVPRLLVRFRPAPPLGGEP
jgi:Holliday junction resolvase RusA-like endonuclease